ncbi:RNA-binding protein 34 [Notothenia coriiceps]|uniref:RNA-binding protein 34 n=1 Tax=Notothenia coriiceps TaxID=8208 RepID=A0A6I9MNE2_9TELE|nr:PREDICTED: RNA-binding protein 34 [Notothenia coriiceps]
MKKKLQESEEEQPEQPEQPADYVVGQVSGSLFKKKSKASGSLSALFRAAAPAPPVLFQPAPKPVPKITEETEEPKETPEVKVQLSKKRQKQLKEKTEGAGRQVRSLNISIIGKWFSCSLQYIQSSVAAACSDIKTKCYLLKICCVCSLQVREDPAMSRKLAAIQRKVHPKKQSMNAYVVFKDQEGVTKALERNGMEIEKGFHIRVDKVTESSAHDHKRSVFVGNLSFEINELSFRQHFEECGDVEGVRLVRDQNSGLGKGFGYVLFESADSVQLALELDGSKLETRTIRVKRSVKKEKQKKTPEGKGAPGRPGKGPMKGPMKGSGPEKGGARGGFKAQNKFSGNRPTATTSSGSFKGEMTDPNKKSKKKGPKKPRKPRKTVHI